MKSLRSICTVAVVLPCAAPLLRAQTPVAPRAGDQALESFAEFAFDARNLLLNGDGAATAQLSLTGAV